MPAVKSEEVNCYIGTASQMLMPKWDFLLTSKPSLLALSMENRHETCTDDEMRFSPSLEKFEDDDRKRSSHGRLPGDCSHRCITQQYCQVRIHKLFMVSRRRRGGGCNVPSCLWACILCAVHCRHAWNGLSDWDTSVWPLQIIRWLHMMYITQRSYIVLLPVLSA